MADDRAGGVRDRAGVVEGREGRRADRARRMSRRHGFDLFERCERTPAVCRLVAGQRWGCELHGKRFFRIGLLHNVMFSCPILG